MIRVLHSVSNMDRGGIETMLMNYYRHIDRSKIQFDFLCNKTKPGAYDDEIRKLGGRIFHTPGLNPLKYPQYLKFMSGLFKEYPEYQIVEAHNGALGVYALHSAKMNHIPVRIYHAHGAGITKDWKMLLKLACKALLPYNINHHFSCGKAAAEYYFGRRITSSQEYTLIPNAIEIDQFVFSNDARTEIRKKYNLENKHVVGHVGRFVIEKNHAFLLEIFAALQKKDPQAHLVMLGEGELMEEIQDKAKQLGIYENVSFVGVVTNAHEWYSAFDTFVMTSFREGLPLVGVEAQASDLPCVFSKAITPEIGLLDDASFVELSAGVDRWVGAIEAALQRTERKNVCDIIAKYGYDISVEAVKLQERYLELAEADK